MTEKLNFLGILGNMGFYMGAVEMMSKWHMFFSLTLFGILTGMIEDIHGQLTTWSYCINIT
jgi:hypothetical protein